MLSINNTNTDPYFNIAAEKYLLKNKSEAIFMMWQNEPAVIIGKHQNVVDEVDMDFAYANQIKVVRRISGGGTVYHDLGNVNLTFIERNSTHNFSKFPQMIIGFLKTIGINAEEDARLGLKIGGLKISGSAQYISKDVTLFHATLLFSSNLTMLENVLVKEESPVNSKYVKSVRSPVTNISEHLPGTMQMSEFKQRILNHFTGDNYAFDEKDIASIEQLKIKNHEYI